MQDFSFDLTGGISANGDDVVAHVRFDDMCGNGHQTFSVTGTSWEKGKPHIYHYSSGGCIHDLVAEAYPALAPFIRWHLTSSDGPLHYHANAAYWARKARGYYRVFKHSEWDKPGGREWEHFRSTVIFGAVDGDDDEIMHEPIAVSPPEGVTWEQYDMGDEGREAAGAILESRVHKWCIAREKPLMQAFWRDMEDVRTLA